MKHLIFLVAVLMINGSLVFAQNSLQLNIHHKLGTDAFSTNVTTQNNLGEQLYFTRLDYYISGISVIHDGGQETIIPDHYILVKAPKVVAEDLGSYNINQVEAIHFYIGVDEAHNHLDPSTYPETHPLAHQNPTMHWGWAGGYRFGAIEGYAGPNLNQGFNLHGLGDVNYFKTEISVAASAENNQIMINLDADYTRVLENISVAAGLVEHGEENEAKQTIENFRDFVFSASGVVSTITDLEIDEIKIFPNPISSNTELILENVPIGISEVSLTNTLGVLVGNWELENGRLIVPNLDNGFYLLNFHNKNKIITSKKLIVK